MNTKMLLLITLILLPQFAIAEEAGTENKILVTVNGVPITQEEVQHFTSTLNKPVTQQQVVQEMINVELLVQAAKNEGALKDPALALELKRNHSALIASHYLQQHLSSITVTEEALKSLYDQQYKQADKANEYNANHILVKTEAEAKNIIAKLDKGDDFAELAKTLSIGPSGKQGGALGWFESGSMVAPFSQATIKLSKGQYSKQPVKTQFGWHIILLNDTRVLPPPPFESVRKQLSTAITAESISNKLKSLHDAANLELPAAQ